MSALTVEALVTALEAFTASLKASGGVGGATRSGAPSSAGASGAREETAFPDSMLAKDWADKTASKDCDGWTGDSQVGQRFSDAPSAWHMAMARSLEVSAERGRGQSPVRKQNNGKPWHEADTFNAKLHRAWAARNEGRAPAPRQPALPQSNGGGDGDFGYGANASDDEIPFVVDATLFGRWDRP